MSPWFFLAAAVVLSLERLFYIWVWHAPETFLAFCEHSAIAPFGTAVDILQKLFYVFKGVQFAVFLGWCYSAGEGLSWPPSNSALAQVGGMILIVAGQLLNLSVFYRLGKVGVFYGNRLGYVVPWCQAFPYSLLKHPQYVGTLLSIWGFFVLIGFPQDGWYLIPMLETVYYTAGAYFEQ